MNPQKSQVLSNRLPLSLQVAQVLRNRISRGQTPPGSRIAPEVRLAEEFGVSVITVQRALKDLEGEGLITRHRGRGTFVAEERMAVVQPARSVDALALMFMDEFDKNTRILSRDLIDCPASLRDSFTDQAQLMRISRVVYRDGKPWSHAVVYLPAALGKALSTPMLRKYPIFRLVREKVGVELRDVDMSLQSVSPDSETASVLELNPLEPVLLYNGALYDIAGALVTLIQISFPGNRFIFRFNIDLRKGEVNGAEMDSTHAARRVPPQPHGAVKGKRGSLKA